MDSGSSATHDGSDKVGPFSTTVSPLTTTKKDDIGDIHFSEIDDDDDEDEDDEDEDDDDKEYPDEDDNEDDYAKPVDNGVEPNNVDDDRHEDRDNNNHDSDDLDYDVNNKKPPVNSEDEQDFNSVAGSEVSIMGRKQSTHASFFARPGILAGN